MWTFLVMLTGEDSPGGRRRVLWLVLAVGVLVGLLAAVILLGAAALHLVAVTIREG